MGASLNPVGAAHADSRYSFCLLHGDQRRHRVDCPDRHSLALAYLDSLLYLGIVRQCTWDRSTVLMGMLYTAAQHLPEPFAMPIVWLGEGAAA